MAGRKPPTNPGLWTLLLDKIGLAPTPKKGKKGKRKKGTAPRGGTQRLDAAGLGDPALDAIVNAPVPAAPGPGSDPSSPFAQYGAESGMGFADALGYEAAAAAGYAPPMPAATSPAAGDSGPQPTLPFSVPDRFAPPPKLEPASDAAVAAEAGKLFNEAALDSSLDALFSGLESGMASPPPALVDDRPTFDEFGLSAPVPVTPAEAPPVPAPPPPPAPVAEERPKPPPPIRMETPVVAPPPATTPPAPVLSAPSAAPLPMAAREPGQLPAAQKLELSLGVDIRGLMGAIDRAAGVAGSMVVGYDGLIIMSTVPGTMDRDYLGAQATSLFTGTGVQLEKLKRGELRRLLLESAEGSMLLTAADMGILVVVSQDGQAMDVGAVLTTIAGSLGMG